MSGDTVKESHLIVVKWKPKDIKEDLIQTFICNKPGNKPIKVHLGRRSTALVEFDEKDKRNVEFLRRSYNDEQMWTITEMYGIPSTCTVKVSNLPPGAKLEDTYRFFTNIQNTNKTMPELNMDETEYNATEGWCLAHLPSHEDVKKIVDGHLKFKTFRDRKLTIETYYSPLEDLLNRTVIIKHELVIENIDPRKFEFLKSFEKDVVENQLEYTCAKVTWGEDEEKVKLTFSCPHIPPHTVNVEWSENVSKRFSERVESVAVIEKLVSKPVWKDACALENGFDGFIIKKDEKSCIWTIIGYGDEKLARFVSMLDALKPPPEVITKTKAVKDKYKLEAFEKFGLARKISSDNDIQIHVDTSNLQLKITGVKEDAMKHADKEITDALLAIQVQRYDIKDQDYADILNTGRMKDEIKVMMKKHNRCLAIIEGNVLVVIREGDASADSVYKDVLELIHEQQVRLEGKVESEAVVKTKMKEIADEFRPVIKLSHKLNKGTEEVIINVKCPIDYVDPVLDRIHVKIGICLVKAEHIFASPFIVKQMFENKYFEALEGEMKSQKIDPKCLIRDKDKRQLSVHGDTNVREKVKVLVKKYMEKINVSWTRVEEEGIDGYFNQSGMKTAIKDLQQQYNCSVRIATIHEMKENNIHCITLLDSGQTIFAGTDDLTELKLPVDVIVNAANTDLDHRGGLAKKIAEIGGKAIERECNAYIHTNGKLKEGDVFMGTAGNLNHLKVVHAVGPVWRQGGNNESLILERVIVNILQTVASDDTSVLRSIALPLISAGVFSFPRKEAATIILSTLKKNVADFRSIREIYLYDTDPAIVRTIQDEMDQCFRDNCYHLPVHNIGVGKGKMTTVQQKGNPLQKRRGTRTLPLPGKKKITIVWGRIEKNRANVVVNTTETAPKPSGTINQTLHKAAGPQFDLNRQVERAFQKKSGSDGTLVVTKAGHMPCIDIYTIKIAHWDDNNGEANVCEYIKICLQECVRSGVKSIAFPTIGTRDLSYNGVKVARASIRTIGEFMKLHTNSKLEEVKIVIFETDVICTAAFEHVIENIYSQRPHRLEAVIEETSERIDGEEKESTEQVHHVADDKTNKPKGDLNTFQITPKAKLVLELGNIEKCKDKVIVCTSSESFPTLNGAISAAITKAGGPGIQKHCNETYRSYPGKGIATAPGGRLQCQRIYILKLLDYKKPEQGKIIYTYVKECLEKADADRFASIAFPTIGTGGFKFPDTLAATKTFQAIQDFFKRPKTCVDTVRIIMYPQAQMSIQTFTTEARNMFGGAPPPALQPPPSQTQDDATVPASAPTSDSWSVPNTKATIEISHGNLEKAQADVILNTTTSFPNLNGIISTSLAKVAGNALQKECTDYPHKVTYGDIAETKGYGLQCQKVFHFVLPAWGSSGKQKMIHDKMNDCLHLVKQSGFHSLAIPSIGTGGYKYDPSMVAHGIYEALRSFGEKCPDYQCVVKLVLFPAAQDVNKVFTDVLGQVRVGQKPKKGVRFDANDSGDQQQQQQQQQQQPRRDIKDRKVKDFVLFQIVSDDPKNEKGVIDEIKRKVKDDTRSISIDLKKDKIFDDNELMSVSANEQCILEIGKGYTTKVDIDIKQRKIRLKGMGENVLKCQNKILDEIRELRSKEGQKKVGNVVHQYLEWCYTEDDGKLWVPYPRRIAYMLEDAYKQNEDKKEFKDSDEKEYVVDFKTMIENVKGAHDKKKSVDVIRKDLTVGDIDALPDHWAPMGSGENLKEIILKASDQEYMGVEQNFKATLGAFRLQQIVQIKRIQNQTLFQQYSTKKKQLQTDLKGIVQDVEKTLWHGIKETSEAPITSNGFNRAYAGETHGGQVYYGHGTYFAVNSGYSATDVYSPIGSDGNRRMYMVKVLTGRSSEENQGYDKRYAPLIDGSKTDSYNSVCDHAHTEYVIFNDTQAYPEYMIWYK